MTERNGCASAICENCHVVLKESRQCGKLCLLLTNRAVSSGMIVNHSSMPSLFSVCYFILPSFVHVSDSESIL